MRQGLIMSVLLSLAACDEEPFIASDNGLFSDGAVAAATVQGFVWDPEIYVYAFMQCSFAAAPGRCALPPLELPNTPLFGQAVIPGAIVGLFDPTNPLQTMPLPYMAAAPTSMDGGYSVMGVPLRSTPPFFAVSVVPQGLPGFDGGLPTATYLPTLTAKPIATGKTTLCLDQAAGAVSDSGPLDAVAKFLTKTGTPTTIADLTNPMKTAGVAVWWLWLPGPGALRVPAFGAQMTADIGTTYQISWLPPGTLPPFLNIQSARGYFVNAGPPGPMGPPPAPGLFVTVLPPLMGLPPAVTFTASDPVMDSTQGRPITFPPLPPSQIPPGMITFGELQGLSPGAGAPPDWVCLP